jgi:predicted acetyltransferase
VPLNKKPHQTYYREIGSTGCFILYPFKATLPEANMLKAFKATAKQRIWALILFNVTLE